MDGIAKKIKEEFYEGVSQQLEGMVSTVNIDPTGAKLKPGDPEERI